MAIYITVKQLSSELGLDPSNMRKYILKHGFSPVKVRTQESKRQLTLALLESDAEMIRGLRQEQGFTEAPVPYQNNKGYFYIIQLIPELAPNRVKLGFASDTQARLNAHRTSSPTAILIKYWACSRSWELAAIACLTRIECSLIANEVFECQNLSSLVKRADEFFSIMPSS